MRKSILLPGFLFGLLVLIFLSSPSYAKVDRKKVITKLSSISVPFIENRGQVPKEVAFYAKTFGGTVFVTRSGQLVYSLPAGKGGVALKEILIGADIKSVKGEERSITKVSYFTGSDRKKWISGLTTYNYISLGEPWRGIKLKIHAHGKNVEKLFYIEPEVDPEKIRVRIEGAKKLELTEDGRLRVITEKGDVYFTKPLAYQNIDGKRKEVEVSYVLEGCEYSFRLGKYDPKKAVVIDPLLASTYLGDSGNDGARAIAIDASGNVYVAGHTDSSHFPTTAGAYDESYNGYGDTFISKLSGDLSHLLASTYLGGESWDMACALAIDASGNVYVAGDTDSSHFPTTAGAYDESYNGYYDVFISKLNGNLTQLLASTFLGGRYDDEALALILDKDGNVYVTGKTYSPNFPTSNGAYDRSLNGDEEDVFISKLNGNLTQLLASTYLGGGGFDVAFAVTLDSLGNVYVSGYTWSSNFPTTSGAYDESYNGWEDAFISKLNGDLTQLLASTYLGGGNVDGALALAIDASGNVYVAGDTYSSDFPTTTGAYNESYNGGKDAFISKLDANLSGKTTVTAVNYNFANISTKSNNFQMWVDISINGQASHTICNDYNFVVESSSSTGDVEETGCDDMGPGLAPGSERYRVWFRIHPDNPQYPHAAYFENGTVKMCRKDDPSACYTLPNLSGFSVYGTTFDVTRDAWYFENGAWATNHSNKDKINQASKATEVISRYIKEDQEAELIKDLEVEGMCYGMANTAIANFCNSGNSYWGDVQRSGGIEETDENGWRQNIESHWNTNTERAIAPYKPFPEDGIYSSNYTKDEQHDGYKKSWTVEAVRKITYYFVAQNHYTGDQWIGKDDSLQDHPINESSRPNIIWMLKTGRPILFGIHFYWLWNWIKYFHYYHAVALTELIHWNSHDKFIIWDNNFPYEKMKKEHEDYGPYEEWWIEDASNYDSSYSRDGKYISLIKKDDGNGWHKHMYKLAKLPYYLPPSGDSQGIYGFGPFYGRSSSKALKSAGEGRETGVQYPYLNHIEVLIVGGKVDSVSDRDSGSPITLIPYGEIKEGQAVIITTSAGTFNALYLPVDKTYRIDVTKFSDMPFLKVFVTVPNGDGTIDRLNYEHVELSENDATHIYFYVGRGNTDKGIRRSGGAGSYAAYGNGGVYNPDYDATLSEAVGPPANFRGTYRSGAINLSWQNPSNPNFSYVKIVRKEGSFPQSLNDGTLIYQGGDEAITDSTVEPNHLYFYAAYSVDRSSNTSKPTYTSIDTSMYSVYGRVSLANGTPLEGASLTLKDPQGKVVGLDTTGPDGKYTISNIENGTYTLEVSHPAYEIQNPARNIHVDGQSVEENFEAAPIPYLAVISHITTINIGDTVMIQWTYRNVSNDETVDIRINRGEGWEDIATQVPITWGQINWRVTGPESEDATLRVSLSNNPNAYAEDSFKITGKPTVDSFAANPTSGPAPLAVNFTCSAHDPDGSIDHYEITYGDESSDTSITGSFIHTYQDPGSYTATCKAVDDQGNEGFSSPIIVDVYIKGDVDNNQIVDIVDALLASMNHLGIQVNVDFNFQAADVDGDGNINTTDAVEISEKALGLQAF